MDSEKTKPQLPPELGEPPLKVPIWVTYAEEKPEFKTSIKTILSGLWSLLLLIKERFSKSHNGKE